MSTNATPIELKSMAWETPRFTKGRVDAAGYSLACEPLLAEEYDEHLSVINNWRSSHAYPLQCLKTVLWRRAKLIDTSALIAQRLKRLPSIYTKLQRFGHMQLSQMQDIGGCRAVVGTARQVDQLVQLYEDSSSRYLKVKLFDYIKAPKADGYRGVHLVYKYRSVSKMREVYNGLRIEIQLRSRLQHAWATAVETASTFTGQALKSNVGSDNWKRFFALMGSAIALRENQPIVPGITNKREEMIREILTLSHELKVESVLERWGLAINYVSQHTADAYAFLLELDPHASRIRVTGFRRDQLGKASEEYLKAEQAAARIPAAQAVLVSVKSVQSLKSAYPNYYLDSKHFLEAMRTAIATKL